MAQWGSYGSYWQGACPGYYDYTQPAQTYDYNHQTIPVSSVQEKPSTPPPPGVESTAPKMDGTVTMTSSISATYDTSWCTSTPFHSQNYACAYTYSPALPPRQPVMFDPSPQRPMMPNVSYPSYGSPQFPLHMRSQLGCNWNAARPTYGYPVNGGAVQSFGMWPDGRPSVHSNGLAVTGPRFPFQSTLDSPNTVASENTANTPISKEVLQQPPASFQDKGAKEQWSDELKEYVQRAFCSIDTSEEKDQMERILKEKLEYVFRNNIKVDWKTENIPTIPSRAIASFRKSFNIRGNSVNTPQLATRGNSKGRRRRRGCASNADSSADANTSNEDGTAVRGRGRGNWRGKRGNISKHTPPSESRLTQRASRFKDHLVQSPIGSGSIGRTTSQLLSNYTDERDDLAVDFGSCQIIGTMQEIEKQYLRLTRAPDPTEVRPLAILKLSLEHVKEKWRSNTDYHWVCEQFKSIRQDLTVQGIEDDFAVSVYEAHADVALEAGDFEEFHQCQSQLLRLHKEGLGVSRLLEFTAYRLLYYIFTLDILGINTIMAGLRPTHKTNPCISFALKLRSAWSLSNYHRFFKLLCPANDDQQPPLRCKHVVNWFVDRERKEAIRLMFKVFRPTISLSFISKLIGFSSTALCKDFICKEFTLPESNLEPIEKIDAKVVWSLMCSQST
ncbi:unnamed protein product [Schistosoma margrebowiei]|uniref:SAC3/GANP/THP3 conserved domain-containing protein n=1 Tax=Schistosoma margrebowiei TaxID=48269 RepID=A0AA84ZFE9_9TREM|nr:unnamed protein product [Schistosoma margrebowiei]